MYYQCMTNNIWLMINNCSNNRGYLPFYIMLNVFTCISGEGLVIVHHDSKEIPSGMNEKLVGAFDIQPSPPKSIPTSRVADVVS